MLAVSSNVIPPGPEFRDTPRTNSTLSIQNHSIHIAAVFNGNDATLVFINDLFGGHQTVVYFGFERVMRSDFHRFVA